MGILYDSVKLQTNMKREFVLERLSALGVTETRAGKSIHDLDYGELKVVLVLAEMRKVDIEHPDHKWFR
jgi:hypothetical protein